MCCTSPFIDSMYFVLPSFTASPTFADSRSIALNAALTSPIVHPMMSMSSAYARSWTHLLKIEPLRCTPAFRSTLSMRKLKRSHDKGSPCLKPRTASKGSGRSFPTLTELNELVLFMTYKFLNCEMIFGFL